MTAIDWFYCIAIFACAIAGGLAPFVRQDKARKVVEFPNGESFASGVFLALALMIMMPAAFSAFRKELPSVEFPVASLISIVAFLVLLVLEHVANHVIDDSRPTTGEGATPAAIPIALTAIIAMPSFLLGASLGMSDREAGLLIFFAVILHKGTAAFALALTMARSSLTRSQSICLLVCFALTTPLGVVVGGVTNAYMSGDARLIKAIVLSLGAGTFLYMGTLHELKRTPFIQHCCKLTCFLWMLFGLLITGLVKWIIGEAHRF